MAIKNTLELFNLDRIDRDVFQWKGQNFGWQRIYGGQVMAQCLIAANHTVEAPHQAHSFHSYFLRPGIMEESILFDVDRIRNGKSFTTRRVRAIQNGEAIFACSISFQKEEKGFEHQIDIDLNEIPKPDNLNLEVYKSKEAIFASIRYSGYNNSEKQVLYTEKLLTKLKDLGRDIIGTPILLSYDAPYKFYNRRKEILIELLN